MSLLVVEVLGDERMVDDKPTSTLKEAGFRDSREGSSFRGVRHFWQWSLNMVAIEVVEVVEE